jgi:nitroreductase
MSHPHLSQSVAESAIHRRSIRRFTAEEVSDDAIWEILTLTGRAASTQNMQPWRMVAVKSFDLRQSLMAASFNQKQVGAAPVVIVLYSELDEAMNRVDEWFPPSMSAEDRASRAERARGYFGGLPETEGQWLARTQANIALGYLLLVLESFGYGSSPMLGFEPEKVKALLGLPEKAMISALVAFGHPDESGYESVRLPIETIAKIV